jgi:hypothetical protein
MNKELQEINKQYMKDHHKDKVRYADDGMNGKYKTFVIFDDTDVAEGGWLIGRKWMTAKFMNKQQNKFVDSCYKTRADNVLITDKILSPDVIERLIEIDKEYDLSAGCGQCGGCRWFAAMDSDYGICFGENSPNEGKLVFEHGGCIYHHFIQELLKLEGCDGVTG